MNGHPTLRIYQIELSRTLRYDGGEQIWIGIDGSHVNWVDSTMSFIEDCLVQHAHKRTNRRGVP